jgi:two-component system, chemotaxis family, protein-glutamate methylesterase/glutaminase
LPALSTHALAPGQKVRVLVVDDSVVIRRLICHALEQDPLIEVVGVAPNGAIALNRIAQLEPDVVTLDIEMPEMDDLEMLRSLRPKFPRVRVVMFSTLTERGATATLEALALGADDYVTKASNAGSLDVSLDSLKQELLPKIHQFFAVPRVAPEPRPTLVPRRTAASDVIAIGISTGGPSALATLIPQLPATIRVPVLIVQHMPPLFTRLLAERLDARTPLEVREATAGDPIVAGRVYIAPGDFHMRAVRGRAGLEISLDQAPPLNSCRPAVDALFTSIADLYGAAATGAVLTGMGQDGLEGSRILKAKGATVIVQDEASSVVWGMPGAVAGAGLADQIVPLSGITGALLRQIQ